MKTPETGAPQIALEDDVFPLPLATAPMEAKSAATLPEGDNWQYEPKWDGFRCLVFKSGDRVELRAKSGKPLGRYFPEVVAMFRAVQADDFVLDGELVIEINGRLAFDALQMRLHPAESRIRKLSQQTPARFSMFDMLAIDGQSLMEEPLSVRRVRLEAFTERVRTTPLLMLSAYTLNHGRALTWLS